MSDHIEAEIERQLRDLFRAEEPPPALADRICARARQAPAGWGPRRAPLLGWCAALVLACMLVALPALQRRRVEQERAREAQARLTYALRIATGELDWAEARVGADWAGPKRQGANQP